MIDVPIRLRRAIATNDVALVKRILKNNPTYLTNSDFNDKSNTSLHLAAQYGFLEICEHLVALGHDSTSSGYDPKQEFILDARSLGISHNTDGRTPLHLASSHSHTSVVKFLTTKFPQCINRPDTSGMTPLMLAARGNPDSDYIPPPLAVSSISRDNGPTLQSAGGAAGMISTRIGTAAIALSSSKSSSPYPHNSSAMSQIPSSNPSTIEHFLSLPSMSSQSPPLVALVSSQDSSGNTPLHHASASGNLKAVRSLILAGADPLAKNHSGWTPEAYSVSVQAEVYFKGLINEWRERTTARERMGSETDERWRSRTQPSDMARRAHSNSPEKIKNIDSPMSDDRRRTRARQGTFGSTLSSLSGGEPSPSSLPTANLSGMGKGGLRLVMPDEDEGDQFNSDGIPHPNPYISVTRNQANNRRRGMSDNSHSSSTTSGSGSTELSSGSSSGREPEPETGAEDAQYESEELSDEDDDETETVRNSAIYSPEGLEQPYLNESPGSMMPSPLRVLGRERPRFQNTGSDSTSLMTPTQNDLWK